MKKTYFIYGIIAIICIVAIVGGVLYQINLDKPLKPEVVENEIQEEPVIETSDSPQKYRDEFISLFDNTFYDQGNDTTKIKKIKGFEEQEVIYAAYNIKEEQEGKYNVDINLPAFNVDSEDAASFNETTQKVFANKAGDVLFKSDKYTIYNVQYVAYLNEDILSLVIKSTLKEGDAKERLIVQTYNYDITTGKAITLNQLLEKKGITQKEVNRKITQQVRQAAKETEEVAEKLANAGQTVYERDINNAMYVTDNVNQFFMGKDGQIYIIYPYGNTNLTSEIDVIKV